MDLDPFLLNWCTLSIPVLLLAVFVGIQFKRVRSAVLTTALGFWLGPFSIFVLVGWIIANARDFRRRSLIEQEERALAERMVILRQQWDDESISWDELIEFAKMLKIDRRTDEALVVLEKALSIQPQNAETWREKARLHWFLGQREEEASAYRRAEELARVR